MDVLELPHVDFLIGPRNSKRKSNKMSGYHTLFFFSLNAHYLYSPSEGFTIPCWTLPLIFTQF